MPLDREKIAALSDDEYDAWLTRINEFIEKKAEASGITPEEVANVKAMAEGWREKRAIADRSEEAARKSAEALAESGRRLMEAQAAAQDPRELPN
jgi:hypothetical protein